MSHAGLRHIKTDVEHGLLKNQPVLAALDGVGFRADKFCAQPFQRPAAMEFHRRVQRCLSPQGRQHRVRFFLRDNFFDHLGGDRLDIGAVGELGIGHDGRRVRVDQDDAVAFLAQRLAGLDARIVELAPLADDDRAGSDDKDGMD